MTEELKSRLRWSDHPGGTKIGEDRAAMARAFAYLFGSGATLAFVTIPLDSAHDRFLPGIIAPAIVAYLVVVLMLWRFDRLPLLAFEFFPAAGTVLVSLAVISGGAQVLTAYSMFYFWVVLAAFYFFERKVAVLHLLLVSLCFTIVLAFSTATDKVLLWLMTIGTLTVAGGIVRLLSERMQTLVDQLGNAARTDPLTGLLNRRGLAERADVEFSRARRSQQPLAMILCDLDHFKAINDLHGHEGGDQVLVAFANLLRLRKRSLDAAARTGGEEFALLLPDTSASEALLVAERVRITTYDAFVDDPVQLTLSLGVAAYPANGTTVAEVMRAADSALYSAKVGGRDRTVLSAAPAAVPLPPVDQLRASRKASSE